MGYGIASGLFGVIREVSLGIHTRGVADNFHCLLVGAHCTVGTEAVELALNSPFRRNVDCFFPREGKVCYIVNNSKNEAFFRLLGLQVLEASYDVGGYKFLGAKSVTSTDD